MILRPGTWAEVEVGRYIADDTGKVWLVNAQQDGWTQLVDAAGVTVPVQPMPPAAPVRIYDLTHHEAEDLLTAELGAARLMHMEQIGTQDRRQWKITCGVSQTARDLAGHITHMHGGIDIDPTTVAKRTRGTDPDFEEMNAFHDKLHADAAAGKHVMRFAHHHDPAFDEGGVQKTRRSR